MFPQKKWMDMSPQEKHYFESLPEEDLSERWQSPEGRKIIAQIINTNIEYGSSDQYSSFLGTIGEHAGEELFDLRGIDFSNFSNIINDEIFGFDFSNCNLKYSNFSQSFFSSSNFRNSDILYSDFSHSILDFCDFSNTNLTLTDLSNSTLESSDFRGSWITDVDFSNANLGFIKFSNKTDFQNINVNSFQGTTNPIFLSFIKRKHYLKHFKAHNRINTMIYYLWWLISDCGQSFSRWFITSIVIIAFFGYLFNVNSNSFFIANGRQPTPYTFYYYSTVAFTTLGFGDIVPKDIIGEILISIEVILGYIMLGGLLSIFSSKFVPKE